MSEKEKKFMDAAMRVFWRYGIERSSMADIAKETGVSRQTLYKSFSSKDDLVRAIMRDMVEERNRAIDAAISEVHGLAEKLDIVFRFVVREPVELLSRSQHAVDIVRGVGDVGREELAAEALSTQEIFRDLFAPHAPALKANGLELDDFALLVQKSCRSIKETATGCELDGLLDCLKSMVLLAAEN